jgi:hypothetical protein
MAWVRPSRSRPNGPRSRRAGPGKGGDVAGNSGEAGASSLAGGGPTALGGGVTGLGRRGGARAPRDQCHQPGQIVPGPGCCSGFSPLLLAPSGSDATCCCLKGTHRSSPPARTKTAPDCPRPRRGRNQAAGLPGPWWGQGGDGGGLWKSAEAGGCIDRGGATAWNQGAVVWPGPVGVDGFRDPVFWCGLAQ